MAMYTPAMMLSLLEDEMKKAVEKIKVQMLGNWKQYRAEKEYEVDESEAVILLTNGFAVKVPVEQAKE